MVIKFDVPRDGSCLFWSVALAYLIPAKNDDNLFQQRYKVLFGNEENVRMAFKDFNKGFCFDNKLRELVTKIFRNLVVDHMRKNREKFKKFVIHKNEHDFDNYLTNMESPGAWGDQPEIKAMSEMLNASITVSKLDDKSFREQTHGNGNIGIKLFHAGPVGSENHYNFGLEEDVLTDEQAKKLKAGLKEKALNDLEKKIEDYLGESLHFADIFVGNKGIYLGYYNNQNSIEERNLKFAVLTNRKDSQDRQVIRCYTISRKVSSPDSRFSKKEREILVKDALLER
ncbi:MAG: hypothetical protein LBE46_00640 [Wolbachia pipientis]|jgi:hypothetical protein|nr:hypothetical protein [Wolbachia pipientis]